MGTEELVVGFIFLNYLILILIAVPIAWILAKAGYTRWWAILTFIPVVNLLGLWILAFSTWPALAEKSDS
ncbi:MAG: hypothetical protein ABI155_02440 [Paralcaligenes sp.]